MDTLVAMELLENSKQGDQWFYSNSEKATKFLTTESPDSYVDMIAMMNKTTYPMFGNLETAVLEGTTQWKKTFGISAEDWFPNVCDTEEAKIRFMGAMHCHSLYGSYAVAKAIDLSAYRGCSDLGGKYSNESFVHIWHYFYKKCKTNNGKTFACQHCENNTCWSLFHLFWTSHGGQYLQTQQRVLETRQYIPGSLKHFSEHNTVLSEHNKSLWKQSTELLQNTLSF